MICGIYKITNLINGKSYIGQSINIARRWRTHKEAINDPYGINYNYPLYSAIRKYGLDNFSFEILEECGQKNLNSLEEKYIKYYNTFSNGYNQTPGGNQYPHYNKLDDGKVLQIINRLQQTMDNSEDIGRDFGVSGRTIRAINSGEQCPQDGITYPVRESLCKLKAVPNKNNYCPICGKLIPENNKFCSQECSHINQRKTERPSREQLKNLLYVKSFVEIGRMYNVNDNSIRKWCDSYNLPRKRNDIKKYSKEEWDLI